MVKKKATPKKRESYWYIEDEYDIFGKVVGTNEGGKVPSSARREHLQNRKKSVPSWGGWLW